MMPGASAFTVAPNRPHSIARLRVSAATPRLGARVHGAQVHAHLGGDRARDDESTARPVEHEWGEDLERDGGPVQVRVDDPLHVVIAELEERGADVDARVGDDDLERTECGLDGVSGEPHLRA